MARKRQDAPKRVREGYNVNVYLPEDLGEAIERFLAEHEPRTDKTGGTELAWKLLLRQFGYWPTPPTAS